MKKCKNKGHTTIIHTQKETMTGKETILDNYKKLSCRICMLLVNVEIQRKTSEY